MRALVLLAAIAACGTESGPAAPRIDAAMPSYGPLVGGSTIQLVGAGFAIGDRVLVGGREAPLVRAIDAGTLEVVIPPGEQPGDAEVVVLAPHGTTSAHGIFRYSTPPAITAVSPPDVVASTGTTTITVTGIGFSDEAAGKPVVVVAGQLVPEVTVISDSELTFVAPPGRIFARPTIELLNQRGRTSAPRAFRYTPSANPGLLLFPRTGNFAVFYDLVTQTMLYVPALSAATARVTSVFRDRNGEYWGVDNGARLGRLDLETQTLIDPIAPGMRLPAVTRVGDQLLAITRYWGDGPHIGTLDPDTLSFTTIGTTPLTCCGNWGIASDGTTVWFTSRGTDFQSMAIHTVDPTSGTISTPVTLALPPSVRIEELRHHGGTLYATTTHGRLVTIDPSTGAVTEVLFSGERYRAMEPFE